MEALDLFGLVIPESQKRLFRAFDNARDNNLLKLYEYLEGKGLLQPHLKKKLKELRKSFID